jgi:hypothetical protein
MLVGTEALFIRKEYQKSSSLFGAWFVCAFVHVRIGVCACTYVFCLLMLFLDMHTFHALTHFTISSGVNVLFWFSIDLVKDAQTGQPAIVTRGPPPETMVAITEQLRVEGLEVSHLISIGGWNEVHPFTGDVDEMYNVCRWLCPCRPSACLPLYLYFSLSTSN